VPRLKADLAAGFDLFLAASGAQFPHTAMHLPGQQKAAMAHWISNPMRELSESAASEALGVVCGQKCGSGGAQTDFSEAMRSARPVSGDLPARLVATWYAFVWR
jgi:hypothetical protein